MTENMKNSIVLMGIDWSKAARLSAFKDIELQSPEFAQFIPDLERLYRNNEGE